MTQILYRLKKPIVKGFWILFLLLALQSFTYSKPYFIVMGIMLLMLSVLSNPHLNRFSKNIGITLTSKQKLFIGIAIFLTAAYSIGEPVKDYYRIFISVGIMLLFWIVTIIYSVKTKLKIKTIIDDENFLRKKTTKVDFNDKSYKKIVKKLKVFCKQNDISSLSANQIGFQKNIIYIKPVDYYEHKLYINPKIIKTTGHTKYLEGCDSCITSDNKYLTCVVERPYSVLVEYYDAKGRKKEEEITSFSATMFCHEYDHLYGKLHMDRNNKVTKKTLKEMKKYRLNHPYKVISEDKKYKYDIIIK